MSLEREAKLAAAAAFRLPPMDGLVTAAIAVTRPRLELEATYFDTAEFQLARWGVTLRHRTGEPGPAWTLKLPGGATEQTLERQELRFAGDRVAVPREASDLVRAYVRGRVLIPVARLRTSRNPIEIREPDGTLLAEIVDDAVSVHEGRRVTSRFREIEIETKDDGRKGRVLAGNLQPAIDALPADDVSLGQHLLKRLRRQAQNARESVLAALRSERYDRLLDALVRTAGAGQPLPEGALQRHRKRDAMAMNNLVRTRWRRLAAAVEALGDDPPDAGPSAACRQFSANTRTRSWRRGGSERPLMPRRSAAWWPVSSLPSSAPRGDACARSGRRYGEPCP